MVIVNTKIAILILTAKAEGLNVLEVLHVLPGNNPGNNSLPERICQKVIPRPISKVGFLRETVLTPAEAWK